MANRKSAAPTSHVNLNKFRSESLPKTGPIGPNPSMVDGSENPPAAWAALDPNFRRGDDAFLHHSCEKRESSFSVQLIEREIEL
jgi:hypothetical protein